MKIAILAYLENRRAEPDPVIDQVAQALKQLGHNVSICGIHDELARLIRTLSRNKIDLVFNLMEMFGKNIFGDVSIAGVLDLIGVPYTGGGPGELHLQQDKSLTKKLLAFEGIRYPDFAVFSPAAKETTTSLRMPLFVKPLRGDASIGINGDAVVRNRTDMLKRISDIHTKVRDLALVEEYIEGREFSVGVLGNGADLRAFPPVEIDFSGLPPGKPHVLDKRAKWSRRSVEFRGTKAHVPDIPADLSNQLQSVSTAAARALHVRDYARIDLRLNSEKEVYVIEANASCYLDSQGEFVMGAKAAGLEYPDLISRIVDSALGRYPQASSAGRAASGT
jgi:D-alanine-D-alanine ligase